MLHKASAEIGVATANLYPKITLTGSYGYAANSLGELFDARFLIWNVAGGLVQPLFHGGTLAAKRRAAIALYDQALAQYRLTILQSFQNVADALRALEIDAAALKAQVDAEQAARQSAELTRKQYELGTISYLLMLDAQRQYQAAYILLVQAKAARYADTAALYAALGGGWWRDRGKQAIVSDSLRENDP